MNLSQNSSESAYAIFPELEKPAAPRLKRAGKLATTPKGG